MPENFNAAPGSAEPNNTSTGWENMADATPAAAAPAEAAPAETLTAETAPAEAPQVEVPTASETIAPAPTETPQTEAPQTETPTPAETPVIPHPISAESAPVSNPNAEPLKPIELAAPNVPAPKPISAETPIDVDAFVASLETEAAPQANPEAETEAQSVRNEAVADNANDTIATAESTPETPTA